MKKLFLLLFVLVISIDANCCVNCNKPLRDAIYNSTFYVNLLQIFSAFIVLGLVIFFLIRTATARHNARLRTSPHELTPVPLFSSAMILGIGLGGFADGIVFHQILQWHQVITGKIKADTAINKAVNMFWDGIFHSFTFLATAIGVYLFWKLLNRSGINRSGYLASGGIAAGWGTFNLVEGIINHHIIGLHNVRENSVYTDIWNYGFLGFGVCLLLLGYFLVKKGRKAYTDIPYSETGQPI